MTMTKIKPTRSPPTCIYWRDRP